MNTSIDNNLVIPKYSAVSRQQRNIRNKHTNLIVWFTGRPASGKSSIAYAVERKLFDLNIGSYVLDGDIVRSGVNTDLGFSENDRRENLRRVAEISKFFLDFGTIVLAAFVSPFQKDRDYVREIFDNSGDFIEIYVKCSLEQCVKRDPKIIIKWLRQVKL